MKIEVDGIVFKPYRWDFCSDGMWGNIWFTVPKGTFTPGTNNGAYALPGGVSESIDSHFDPVRLDDDSVQLVHMATPCMENGDDLHKYSLSKIIKNAAKDIELNLRGNRTNAVESVER
jgi:hypothetical protein